MEEAELGARLARSGRGRGCHGCLVVWTFRAVAVGLVEARSGGVATRVDRRHGLGLLLETCVRLGRRAYLGLGLVGSALCTLVSLGGGMCSRLTVVLDCVARR